MSLSSKFQSSENAIASKLLFWISTLQNIAFCSTQGVVLYVRIFHSMNPMAHAYKEYGDFFNLYTLAMPLLSALYFDKVKQQRIKNITNQVEMKFNGADGWTNYSTVIERAWN
ncbi:hypothetical protein GCK32_005528 [Trichostrongylus colubriformis]|uniref:Uncharacterized protein n=1 Tax=Trichostrongylus colubriformis TaxID=6319 RepID=A0AAN8FTG8_TRICO